MNVLAVALFDHPRNSETATFSLRLGRWHFALVSLSLFVIFCCCCCSVNSWRWAKKKKNCWVETPGMGIARIRVFIAVVFPRKSAPPDINYQMLHRGVRDKVLIESCCLRRGLREFVTSPCRPVLARESSENKMVDKGTSFLVSGSCYAFAG